MKRIASALALVALLAAPATGFGAQSGKAAPAASAHSKHEGYYYPRITSREVYHPATRPLKQMDRRARLLFVAGMTQGQSESAYAPRYAIFAKGDDAEKMIIVGLDDSILATIYRARAVMASLSSLARLSPLLKDADLDDQLNFYDIARLIGFTEITISDGRAFTHRVTLQ
jgi:hypothetical protein